ncbi:MAG TPA: transposase [Povalibacter sp.]
MICSSVYRFVFTSNLLTWGRTLNHRATQNRGDVGPSSVGESSSRCLRCRGAYAPKRREKYLDRMKRRIDSERGRYEYARRLGIVEPVFGNIRNTKRLKRFTLRGKRKVNTQWQLFCLVHNIEKIQRHGREERMMRRRGAA